MAYVWQAVDAVEPIADSTIEAIANAAQYNVISGCVLAYDAANMTVDMGAGAIMHNAVPIQIVAVPNAVTLASDPSNPRWTWIYLDSTGTTGIVSGDPAVVPSVPELGNNVCIAEVYVQAGLTIAANATYKTDKRAPNPQGLIGYWGTATSTTSTSEVDLITISQLGFDNSIPVTVPLTIQFNFRKQALAAQLVGFGLKINATVVYDTGTLAQWRSSATNRAEDGFAEFHLMPRSTANYINGFTTFGGWRVTSSGAVATAFAYATSTPTAVVPNAAITSIAIRAINDTTSNAAEVTAVFVYAR